MAEAADTRDKRDRIPTQRGFHNSLVEKTGAFNKQTKLLQRAIASVHTVIEGDIELTTLQRATTTLEINKQTFESSFRNLERLFADDRWGESADVEAVVRDTSQKYSRSADSALQQATEKLNAARKHDLESKVSRRSGRSSRSSASHASSTSARREALADAAVAREEAEYDVMIAERENERRQKEAEEERNRAAARAQHERDMAVLAAKRKKAAAEAKLEAIEQSINEERTFSNKSGDDRSSELSRLRTKIWIQNQRYDEPQIDPKRLKEEKLDVQIPAEEPRVKAVEVNLMADRPYSEPQTQVTHLGNTDAVLQEGMRAVAVTNDKLASSLARINLPKCHPDLFSGDATMFHPWKSTFKGMLRDCDSTPEQEMNYLHMYTRAGPQRLVNSFRKRQYHNTSVVLKELWTELEKRYGNTAIITNSLLVRLKELAKFGEQEKGKLQAFSDLCIDVASQIDQLPGLGCLNYPTAIRPILDNLTETIRRRWEKKVVEFAEKNHDAYPDFKVFATVIEKHSLLRNHPNVVAMTEKTRKDKDPTGGRERKVFKRNTDLSKESNEEKYCPFHDAKGHNLPECKAFARKTLQERTQWIKLAGLRFRCLMQKHLARDCKAVVK
jgi:hypothetical protein